jgi:hypothetical protein
MKYKEKSFLWRVLFVVWFTFQLWIYICTMRSGMSRLHTAVGVDIFGARGLIWLFLYELQLLSRPWKHRNHFQKSLNCCCHIVNVFKWFRTFSFGNMEGRSGLNHWLRSIFPSYRKGSVCTIFLILCPLLFRHRLFWCSESISQVLYSCPLLPKSQNDDHFSPFCPRSVHPDPFLHLSDGRILHRLTLPVSSSDTCYNI